MTTWMKKVIEAEGVTEFAPGPHLKKLEERFGGSGAVMLLLDVSGSMSGNMRAAITGALGFVEEATGGGYLVGAALWHTRVEDYVAPAPDATAVRQLLEGASPMGGTNISSALELAGDLLMKIDVTDRVVAVFGDGDLGDEDAARAEAHRLTRHGIRIITLGLGSASAAALSVISTESLPTAAATTTTLSDDIRGLARGLSVRKQR
ncbi:hypothetical protein AUL38_11675 [Leucobacter sp. G161]|nr:hypothetical protein AUL38_11675 [Leucobacter sp. G161]